tara:strand:+ start:12951 stop:14006 length:1056 start_codon:yes stop_codon:yes gene_type:complete
MSKNALITGITGQDGAYIAKYLLDKNYNVFGTYRRLSTPNFWRLQTLGVFNKVQLISADLIDMSSLIEAIELSKPDEIYHLAAQSFVGASFEQPISSAEITGVGVTKILSAIKSIDKKIRFYQASTSELYGSGHKIAQNEDTIFMPSSPYAAAKLYGHWVTKIYREGYGIHASNGILFNHESPLRGLEFVTRKISNTVAQISLGLKKELCLGNIQARRDWGYAPDYVEAMWLMLQKDEPDDYVIATGEEHSVEEFVKVAFDTVGLNYEKFLKLDKKFERPLDVEFLKGDASKAKKKLGWKPKTDFNKLVKIMVTEDLNKWKKWLNGDRFPWDAPTYPGEDGMLSKKIKFDR